MSEPLLDIRTLHVWRGAAPVLHGIDLQVAAGECVALLGDNGAGKSSLLLAIAGHLRLSGMIAFDGRDIATLPAHGRARAGIGFCPEGRRVFPALTVDETLLVACRDGKPDGKRASIFALFPELERRRDAPAWQLSGGEQQMLAVGRALMGNPRLLLLDEPFLGLAPEASARLLDALRAVAGDGVSLLLADQDTERAKTLCDRLIFLDRGRIHA